MPKTNAFAAIIPAGPASPPVDEEIKVYRHELKYFISYAEYYVLSRILSSHLELDANAGDNKDYWIRSLYFDTINNNDFYEKENGFATRKKIRLRLYDVRQERINLEIKRKSAQFMLKETARVSREEAKALVRGEKDFLLNSGNATTDSVYAFFCADFYRPAVIIDYMREAYMLPFQHIRITFDKDIRANQYHFDMFDPRLATFPVFPERVYVLEIKYHRFLPDWLMEIFSGLPANRSAISKYVLGRYIL